MTCARRLIINADDFGLSEGVNRGIIEAHQAGSVTSASLLPNLPGFDDALRRAREVPQLGVGLHFNLTAGQPVAPAASVSSLCDRRTGRFHSLAGLVARSLAGLIRSDDAARECEAQITRLRDTGLTLTHVDSHRHVHLLPGVWRAVTDTMRRAGIPNLRVPFERGARVVRYADAAAEQVLLRAAYRLAGGNGTQRSVVDRFYGSSLFHRPDFRERLLDLVDGLEPGTAEVMVHPGYLDAEIARWDSYTWERERELRGLTDQTVCERLHRGDIALRTFGNGAPAANGRRPAPPAPRVSLVIPAYNEARYLPRLLDSIDIARAEYRADPGALEVIVADNASTDRTAEIARERGCRVVPESRRVIGAVRNTGAAHARGAVLAFVDADSVVHPQTFRAIDAALSEGCVGGATGVSTDRRSWQITLTFSVLGLWCRLTGWDTGVVFCRRADFEAAGRFDETLLFAEDLAFYRSLSRLGRARGQRFARLRGVRTVTSTRKFEEFGPVRWPLKNVRVIVLSALRSPRARQFIEEYWYKVRT